MQGTLKILKLLSDPTRLRILRLLGREELTVAELQQILGMGQSRTSAHLAQLKVEGLVSDRRAGKNIYYTRGGKVSGAVAELVESGGEELAEGAADDAAVKLVLRKRQDKAGEYFNQLAGKFGRTYVPGRSWRALAHGLLRLLPPMVIADLGAGEGTLSQLLARTAKKVIAIDSSPAMVEFGSKLAADHGLKNLEYRLGEIEAPPIKAGAVDLALFSQALHHAASPGKALSAAHRILKPGGRLLVLDLLSHSFEQARTLYAHVWLGFSEVELMRLIEKAGFKDVEVSVVSREARAPHFQTVLATARK
ncbi:MAG: metalloregulator ArsR/SmtB family transcription factor [Chthoniobacterales bacterium]|nr:metalloregulator ArsR/SmtB family transcription factor [Chthoniobacterales bacterium]